jgi:alcohol dehydrogenase class IV
MAYNVPARPERLATVARLLGEDVSGLSVFAAAERAVEAVQRLKADIGIPMRLRELGVKETQLTEIAKATAQIARLLRINPRPLDVHGVEEILRLAW